MNKNTLGKINLIQEFRDRLIKADIPLEGLHHYTSIDGFKGIIDSKEIWATSANYLLNDPTETTLARKIALEVLEERKKDFAGNKILYENCKDLIITTSSSKEFVCIFSFSEEGDLLSQWRAYCPKGGVSISFNIYGQRDIKYNTKELKIDERYFYKCIYDPQEQKQQINNLFDFLLEHANTPRIVDGFFLKMMQTFSYSFKHESFKEEKEWRLCYFYSPEYDQLRYRTKYSMLIPCLPFSILDNNGHSIISRIMIGPSHDKEKLSYSIWSYLNNSGVPLSPEKIKVTQTPYQVL
jgi:hypothetical protein